jgi:hypothetical protein
MTFAARFDCESLGCLENDMAGNDQKRIAQDVQLIHSAADKMKQMLDELLEMSCIDQVETLRIKISLQDVLSRSTGHIGRYYQRTSCQHTIA